MGKRGHWLIWLCAVGLFAVGMWIHDFSSTSTRVPLQLTPGTSITINEFRIFGGSTLGGSLSFIDSPQQRAMAGSHSSRGDWRKDGYIEFPNPGEAIVLNVSVGGQASNARLHAMPNGVLQGVERDLTTSPPTQFGAARRFPWPPVPTSELTLPYGTSRIEISVIEVGQALQGQSAILEIWSPLGFKTTSPQLGYLLLWWFYLWQVHAVMLAIWACILFALRDRL